MSKFAKNKKNEYPIYHFIDPFCDPLFTEASSTLYHEIFFQESPEKYGTEHGWRRLSKPEH